VLAPFLWVTRIVGADIAVITVLRLPGRAGAFVARVTHRTLVAVLTRKRVVGVFAARLRVAVLIGTYVLVIAGRSIGLVLTSLGRVAGVGRAVNSIVAGHKITRLAVSLCAEVAVGARIAVVARCLVVAPYALAVETLVVGARVVVAALQRFSGTCPIRAHVVQGTGNAVIAWLAVGSVQALPFFVAAIVGADIFVVALPAVAVLSLCGWPALPLLGLADERTVLDALYVVAHLPLLAFATASPASVVTTFPAFAVGDAILRRTVRQQIAGVGGIAGDHSISAFRLSPTLRAAPVNPDSTFVIPHYVRYPGSRFLQASDRQRDGSQSNIRAHASHPSSSPSVDDTPQRGEVEGLIQGRRNSE